MNTPTPWTRPNNKGTLIWPANYVNGQTGYIASVNFQKNAATTEANAALIIRAVNSLEAAQRTAEALARICANPKVQDVIEADKQTAYLIRDARAALAEWEAVK